MKRKEAPATFQVESTWINSIMQVIPRGIEQVVSTKGYKVKPVLRELRRRTDGDVLPACRKAGARIVARTLREGRKEKDAAGFFFSPAQAIKTNFAKTRRNLSGKGAKRTGPQRGIAPDFETEQKAGKKGKTEQGAA